MGCPGCPLNRCPGASGQSRSSGPRRNRRSGHSHTRRQWGKRPSGHSWPSTPAARFPPPGWRSYPPGPPGPRHRPPDSNHSIYTAPPAAPPDFFRWRSPATPCPRRLWLPFRRCGRPPGPAAGSSSPGSLSPGTGYPGPMPGPWLHRKPENPPTGLARPPPPVRPGESPPKYQKKAAVSHKTTSGVLCETAADLCAITGAGVAAKFP